MESCTGRALQLPGALASSAQHKWRAGSSNTEAVRHTQSECRSPGWAWDGGLCAPRDSAGFRGLEM